MGVVVIHGKLRFTCVVIVVRPTEVDAVVLLINLQQISNRITFEINHFCSSLFTLFLSLVILFSYALSLTFYLLE